ncbi:hypothetical protein ACIOJE_35100 [Kitasatospora sp. NPDC087861]|uniref:hypothetical protein n=1 Tax=Kitasatospora sp. NPDC087861 TaxID=3364070 RepID=UPI0037F800A7
MFTMPPLCQAVDPDQPHLLTAAPCRSDATHRVIGYRLTTPDLAAGYHQLACQPHAHALADHWTRRGVRTAPGRRPDPVIARTHPYRPGALYPTALQPAFDALPSYTPQPPPAAPRPGRPGRRTPPPRQPALWTTTAVPAPEPGTPTAGPDDADDADLIVLPGYVRAVPAGTRPDGVQDRWRIECRRTGHGDGDCNDPAADGGWRAVRTVSGDHDTALDWALDHAEHHLPRNNLVTVAELAAARTAAFSAAQADVLQAALRGELHEDLNGYYTPDAGNWTPRSFLARRVRTLLALGHLAWTPDTTGYRRTLPLTPTGRTLWTAWVHARRCELITHADTDTEHGVTDLQRDQYLMLKEEFPAERAAANQRAQQPPPERPPTVRADGHWYRPYAATTDTEQERAVHYGPHRYRLRRAAEDQPMTLFRFDGGPALATGLPSWHQVEQAVTAHAQDGGERGRDELGPRPAIPWGLVVSCPVTIHQVGYRWRDVECADCERWGHLMGRGPGLGEHDTEPAAVHAATAHARHHEQQIRAAMEKAHREEAARALAPHFTAELYNLLAAAADRADGITYDGRTRYRTIPAGTPASSRRNGRPVRRELVTLLQRAGYLHYRRPGNHGPVTLTPDGRTAHQALADATLPATWPTRQAPEKLPYVPEGWAQARIRQQQREHWQRIEAEHAQRRTAA